MSQEMKSEASIGNIILNNQNHKLITSTVSSVEEKTIAQILQEAKEKNMAVAFTFTPGPFKDPSELPSDWMKNDNAIGCTPQLNAFHQKISTDNEWKNKIIVYAVNTQLCEYQSGSEGLLAKKNWGNSFRMISDPNLAFANLLGLSTIEVNQKQYIARSTVVIKPDSTSQTFSISSPVNAVKADDHINEIKNFVTSSLQNQPQESSYHYRKN